MISNVISRFIRICCILSYIILFVHIVHIYNHGVYHCIYHCIIQPNPPICSAWWSFSISFQNDEIRTTKLCCFWSDFTELTATDRSRPIVVTVSVLCTLEDPFLQSLSNIIIAPQWQFRLEGLLHEHNAITYLSTSCRVINAVVTCEIKLFQNYDFSLRRRPSEIILFQRVGTCRKSFHGLSAAHEYFPTRSVHCRRNNFETILELLQRPK